MTKRDEFPPQVLKILLADDDNDDCLFFKDALNELPVFTVLTAVHDGEQLMKHLTKGVEGSEPFPDVLFLDLNMPRKNGFTCLDEIKSNEKLKFLPVIILSTSFEKKIADLLYKNGAHHYFGKPSDFSQLKKIIQQSLSLVTNSSVLQQPDEKID